MLTLVQENRTFFELIATPRREKDSLKTVRIKFYDHYTKNGRDPGSTQQLHQNSNDLIPTSFLLCSCLKSRGWSRRHNWNVSDGGWYRWDLLQTETAEANENPSKLTGRDVHCQTDTSTMAEAMKNPTLSNRIRHLQDAVEKKGASWMQLSSHLVFC